MLQDRTDRRSGRIPLPAVPWPRVITALAGGFPVPKENIRVVGSIEAINRSVIENKGAAVISRLAIESELKYNLIRQEEFAEHLDLNRKIFSIIRRNTPLSMADEIFLDFTRDSLKMSSW